MERNTTVVNKQRLFVDMDGTLTVFTPQESIEPLYKEGYFFDLPPHENVVEAIRHIVMNRTEVDVYILSAYLTDSPYALAEKNAWVDKYLPEIDAAHRIFVPNGSDKKQYIGGLRDSDYLMDDYTKNLLRWSPGKGIKLLNAINHTHGTWKYDRVRYDREPIDLAESIISVMRGERQIFDERVVQPSAERNESGERGRPHGEDDLQYDNSSFHEGDYYEDADGRGIITQVISGEFEGRHEALFSFVDPEAVPGSRGAKGYIMATAIAIERLNRGKATLTPADDVTVKLPEEHEQLSLFDLMNENNEQINALNKEDIQMDNRERQFIENLARYDYLKGVQSNIISHYLNLSTATNPTAQED